MKVNVKQPKYIIPLIILPFLFLGFYLYRDTIKPEDPAEIAQAEEGLQGNMGEVSENVKETGITDKLAAYQDRYREADGYTAIGRIQPDSALAENPRSLYSSREQQQLDSLEALQARRSPGRSANPSPKPDESGDRELAAVLNRLNSPASQPPAASEPAEADPLAALKLQYAYMDSVNKANDPEYQAEQKRNKAKKDALEAEKRRLAARIPVQKAHEADALFTTIRPEKEDSFIKAIIDEQVTGYQNSRVRIRLLEDILVGQRLIRKGTYLYALMDGFSGQRVMLHVTSLIQGQQKLPVNLTIYDMDGMEGIYVPNSAFREFSKELASNSVQGMTMTTGADNQNEFLMSTLQRMFMSTSQAITNLIRKNKATLKYNSYVYLVDDQQIAGQNPGQ